MKLSEEEMVLVESSLEYAIDDVEHYLKHGNPETDLSEGDLTQVKKLPDQWRELRRKIQLTLGDTDEQQANQHQAPQAHRP